MNIMTRNSKRLHRARRARATVTGTPERPRLRVFRSLRSLSAQIIDDTTQTTLVSAHLAEVKGARHTVDGAAQLGALIAKKAKDHHITTVVFDRAGYKYHGKVKALAEAARKGGLQF